MKLKSTSRGNNIVIAVAFVVTAVFFTFVGFGIAKLQTPPTPVPTAVDPISIQNTAAAKAWANVTMTQQAMITPSLTPTRKPPMTLTPSLTLPPSQTPTATQPPLFSPKGNGFFLVNVDIAPGVWRSDGTNDNCYWEVTAASGDILDNHFGMAGGTAYIPPASFQVQFNGCGNWTYVQGP